MSTGYVYDPIFLKHTYPGHPEGAQRLKAIRQALEEADLCPELQQIPSRAATEDELGYIHPLTYQNRIKSISQRGGGFLDPDTYTTPASYQAAATAAGSLIDLTLAVVNGQLDNGFAIVRPPGHHATIDQAMGFCLFNNVAIAAKAAQRQGRIERVAIIDFDVHHGNGTQDAFYTDPDVLFFSTHQYPHYPGTGRADELGRGKARGTTVNFPLPVGVGDEGFKQLYTEVLIPILRRFQPQLILVSAGYDSHWDDPLAQLGLTLTGLAWLSQTLIDLADELCDSRIVFTLEGGYNLNALGHGVSNSIKALLNRTDFADPIGQSPWLSPDMSTYIKEVKRLHRL
jgi:acetoin utilization deacetylase AcuC-like enzyme